LLYHKYGWPLRDFRTQTTQTDLDYQTLFDKNAFLAEYDKYFGHKVKLKTSAATWVAR